MSNEVKEVKKGRGRPKKVITQKPFDPSTIKLVRATDLEFDSKIFVPLKTGTELDAILSTDGGIMPATNMVLVGGPGSGKTTIALDVVSSLTRRGYKCLFVSGEMDEIGYYKYCERMPKFKCVETLFLKNHSENVKEAIEYVFNEGYDVIVIDSIAEVLEMYKDSYRVPMGMAESWFLGLQDKTKGGKNKGNYYTTFINIQQTTKGGEFSGSNRLKHMTDAMCHVAVNKDKTERTMEFSKNRDCDKDFKVCFSFYNGEVFYSYEIV